MTRSLRLYRRARAPRRVPRGVLRLALSAVAVMATLGATAWAAETVVAVANAGMEDEVGGKPTHWQLWTTSAADAAFSVDREVWRGGRGALRIQAEKETLYAIAGQRLSGLRPGELYALSGWIRTRAVLARADYTGACLVTTCKDRDDKILDTKYSGMECGTAEWRLVTVYFMVVEGTATVDVGCVLKQSVGSAWFDDLRLEHCPQAPEPPAPPAVEGTPALAVSALPKRASLDGFGVEWDPRFWRACNREEGVTEADWDLIVARLKKMGVRRFRMGLESLDYEPTNDNDDPAETNWNGFDFTNRGADDGPMYSLYRQLDVCEALGASVTLFFWQFSSSSWLGQANGRNWGGAPRDIEEAAENLAALLQHLKRQKGYTCIKELSPIGEPNLFYYNAAGEIHFADYASYVEAVHRRLLAAGLRNDTSLVGSADSDSLEWFGNAVKRLDPIVDRYDSHMYLYDANTPNVGRAIRVFVQSRVAMTRKPVFLGEFGTGHTTSYLQVDRDTYDRGLFVAVHAISTLKAGGSGGYHWTLHDVYYQRNAWAEHNFGMMATGLWAYKDKGWAVRPDYHSYALVTRYAEPGSRVYDVAAASRQIDAVALLTPRGRWTYLLANRDHADAPHVVLNPQQSAATFERRVFSAGTLPADDSLIPSSGTQRMEHGKLPVTLPARSFVVLTEED